MILKGLTIHGFKSFAEKVTLDFDHGLSVVVGPNGSGKSNITDAIRWVLGEQSVKSLRGAKMEDVIFAGSVKRRPIGMAEVSLILDNSTGMFPLDYAEIAVTRRVYRDGEGEYLINKTPCRLKDIHELFMDTGIGREGFSIIGQGRVEEIFSAKPEERRSIIEEAAGIIKYRNRKREATRKLEDTEQNLLRLADIITELAAQTGPLQEQAETARRYLDLKQALDEQELNLAVFDLGELDGKLTGYRQQIKTVENEIMSHETHLRVEEAEIAKLKLAVQGLDEQIFQQQTHCHELASQIQAAEAEKKLGLERDTGLTEQKTRLAAETEEIKQKAEVLHHEYAAEETKLLALRQQRQGLEAKLAEAQQNFDASSTELGSAEQLVENAKSAVFEVLSESAKLNNELAALQQQAAGLQYRQTTLKEQAEAKNCALAQVNTEYAATNENNVTAKSDIAGLSEKLAAFSQERQSLETNRQRLQQEHQQVLERMQAAKSRYKVLTDMQRDFEGYNRGVKEVLQAGSSGKVRGICGAVAQLIQVPDHLETAIEIAAGGSLQNLVMETEADAKQAIAWLKRSKSGRATFLPLDTIQAAPRAFEPRVLKAAGVLGVAADLISTADKYQPVVEYLLGRVLIVENLELASQVARLGAYRLRIVTLDGELLSPGGSLTGGSLHRSSASLLSRNRELTALAAQVSGLQQQLAGFQASEAEFLEQLKLLAERESQAQAGLKKRELDLAGQEAKIAGLSQERSRLEGEIAQAELESEQVELELTGVRNRERELAVQREQRETEYNELNVELQRLQENLKTRGSSREQARSTITELKVQLASVEQAEKSLDTALKRYYQQKHEFESTVADLAAECEAIEQRKADISRKVEQFQGEMTALIQAENAAQQELQACRDLRQDNAGVLTGKEESERALRQRLQELQAKLSSARVQEARLETEKNTALNRLQEGLGLDLAEARKHSKPVDNRRETVSGINRLKGEVNALGPVNLGAVEEFERVSERFSFLSAQQQDLLGAKQSLFNVIAEMDRIMAERFAAAFEAINTRFAAVFQELFGGGRAELRLSDPDDLLETGVDIVAQPPGKRLQHLSLLSGGEKALTAIALLFAMLQVRPSPFCVLDEIEAALDEANVDRFANYLNELSELTQFIVISHRKGTMTAADVLYGITMEAGVSKLFSVRMSDAVTGTTGK